MTKTEYFMAVKIGSDIIVEYNYHYGKGLSEMELQRILDKVRSGAIRE